MKGLFKMKSRIHIFKINKGVIFSSSSEDEISLVKKYCLSAKIPVCFLNSENYEKNIREISQNFSLYSSENISETNTQFLVLCGFSGSEINHFLDYLNSNGLSIPLKCTATQMNVSMTVSECIECIKEEHSQMHRND